jgi:hypothetical protein
MQNAISQIKLNDTPDAAAMPVKSSTGVNNQNVKLIGNNMIDISLSAPVNFIPRGVQKEILSFAVKDSGNYQVIWKVGGADTTVFYPNRADAEAIDSGAIASLSINGENTAAPKDFLLAQFVHSENSLDDKISFLPFPLESTELMHLNKNDVLAVNVFLKGVPKYEVQKKQNNLPARLMITCKIENAEIILIKIPD